MADENLLSDEFLRQLITVGEVDILIGLPTHNNARTVEPVIRAVQSSILKCFPRERAVIINADGGSQDGTPELITGATIDDVSNVTKVYALRTLHAISTRYARAPNEGIALQTIFSAADLLRAKACVVLSPETTTIEPDWLQRLIRPIYQDNFDLVCPIYKRQKFEGALLRDLLYPMTRAIYGLRIREPYASEFAISGNFATDFISKDTWKSEWCQHGPEIATTIAAVTGSFKVCQAFLGPKPQPDRSPRDLIGAMRRTVGAFFSSLDPTFSFWSSILGSQTIRTLGPEWELGEEPLRVNRKRLRDLFVTGVAELQPVYRSILTASTLNDLQKIAALDIEQFEYPAGLWARTVFEFAASYHKSVINRDHILQAMVPLYRGRTLAFLLENRNGSGDEMEARVESLCGEFERLKPYLLEVWADEKRGANA